MFELRNSADPTSAVSIPSPTYTVNAAGGGTHTTVGGAVASADIANGSYQIVGITPGTYTGVANNRDVTLTTSKPKLLLIGLQGASNTIIQGDLSGYGWLIQNAAVVASLTFQKTVVAHYIDAPSKEVRFIDLIVRDNIGQNTWAGGVHVNDAATVYIEFGSHSHYELLVRERADTDRDRESRRKHESKAATTPSTPLYRTRRWLIQMRMGFPMAPR